MPVKIPYVLPVALLLYSCSRPASEKVSNPLEIFPLNKEWEFVGAHDQDRIILVIKRIDQNKLSYTVELVKNYVGLPLDNGTITFDEVNRDTLHFSGGSEECQLRIKMYDSDEEPVGKRAAIERFCRDSTQNIQRFDFPPLHLRRNRP